MNLNKALKPVALLCSSALHLLANAKDIDAEIEVNLPVVEVQAESLPQRVYTREQMDETPQSNRDLSGLIANNPAIRLANENVGSANKGSLAPESFSIHGESPYQNQFQIDGINSTNVINPHQLEQTGQGPNTLNSYSQSYNIDTDLLDEVEVYDNRVPVELSGFTGGVVNAKIKKPTGTGIWKVKRSSNSSKLTKQNIADNISSDFISSLEDGAEGFSSEWEKSFTSLSGDVSLGSHTNALVAFSRRESEITRSQRVLDLSAGSIVNTKNLKSIKTKNSDLVDNFFLKTNTIIDSGDFGISLKYAGRTEEMVRNNKGMDGMGWDYGQNSYGIGFDYSQIIGFGIASLKIGYDKMASSKEDEETSLYVDTINALNGGGNYTHGGYGSVSENQSQYSVKARYDFSDFSISGFDYKLYAGIDYQHTDIEFNRAQDVNVFYRTIDANGALASLNIHHLYMQGSAKAAQEKMGVYVASSAAWKNLKLSLGARVDKDDLLNRSNFSPRLGLDWDLNGDGSNKFGVGWSRYYGMDIIGYALEKEKSELLKYIKPTSQSAVKNHDFSSLKTPYSDEWAFSYSRNINKSMRAKFEFIHRSSRDGITLEEKTISGKKVNVYLNGGRGNNKTFVAGIHSAKKISFAGAQWGGGIDFSWQDTKRNIDNSKSWESTPEGESYIYVNDVMMKEKNRPKFDLVFPRKINLNWMANWGKQGISWGNRINWISSRNRLVYSGYISAKNPDTNKNQNMNTYHQRKMPSYWTWDAMISYKPSFLKGSQFTVEILNLLNQSRQIKEIYTSTVRQAGSVRIGREIWLNASYEFQ